MGLCDRNVSSFGQIEQGALNKEIIYVLNKESTVVELVDKFDEKSNRGCLKK